MAKQPLVTLLTDFGTREPYVAAMKGVILSMCPEAQIVDITHEIPAHDVLAASFVLAESAPYFPIGTVHVVVVDPGVGTKRKILIGRYGGQVYVFPDNGVITTVAEGGPAVALVVVRNPNYLPMGPASTTFHGRDIFAPVAAHVLNGVELDRFGPQPDTFRLLDLPVCEETDREIIGKVIYVDTFGNLITNIPEEVVRGRWPDLDSVRGFCNDKGVGTLQGAYGFVTEGEPAMLFNSMGRVEIAINRGRASDVLEAGFGAEVRLRTGPLRLSGENVE